MRTLFCLITCSAMAGLGCGGSTGDPSDDIADAAIASYNCAADPRPVQYTVGLDIPSQKGLVDFKLMNAVPAPPARGDNAWTLLLTTEGSDVVAAPLAGATLDVSPYMPDHQHGTPITVGITDQGSGYYLLTPVNLWMPGYWETTVKVKSPASSSDSAVFKFCLSE